MLVARLGLEPRLFCTKNRRVASYTIGHYTWKAKITITQEVQNKYSFFRYSKNDALELKLIS